MKVEEYVKYERGGGAEKARRTGRRRGKTVTPWGDDEEGGGGRRGEGDGVLQERRRELAKSNTSQKGHQTRNAAFPKLTLYF